MTMVERTCACGQKFMAKEADVRRGWAKSCSKSCAARKKAMKPGSNFRQFLARRDAAIRAEELGPTFDNAHQADNTEFNSGEEDPA